MQRLIQFLLILIILVGAAAYFLPGLIPADMYRDQVQQSARTALNRDVLLDGDISLSLIPRVEIRAQDVRIANADGFDGETFAEMSEMRVSVRLVPLLSRTVEITEFVLVDPQIRLQQRGAANNWTFAAADAAAAPTSGSGEGFKRRPGALPIEASFGDVRIENGAISYSDGRETRNITGLDLAVALPSLNDPVNLTGALNADGESLTFSADIGSLRDFFEGRETPFSLELGGALIALSFDGQFAESEDLVFSGSNTLRIPSLRRLAAFAGAEMPPGDQLRDFETAGSLSFAPGRIDVDARSVRLDDISASGAFAVELDRARPRIRGNLALPRLDVTPYLPASDPAATSAGVPPWSEDRIDLAGLGILDLGLRLTADEFKFRDIEVTDADLRVEINNRRLEVVLRNFSLYGGTGVATVVANNRTATPSFSLAGELTGLDAQPFLTAAAGFERLQGTGNMRFNFLTSGASTAAIMNAIDGNGSFSFADGAIVGINIAETIRNVNSFFSGPGTPSGSSDDSEQAETGDDTSTDFSQLSGSFNVQNGQAVNRDLLMLSPLLRVEGAGGVDLPGQTLDYRLRPRAVASIEGQGGDRDLRGIIVPVRIRGSFNDISVGVDTEAVGQALLSGALSNALGGSGQAASPEDALRDGLMNALGLGRPDAAEDDTPEDGETPPEEEDEVDPAEQLLRGLLSRRNRDNN